VTKVAKVVEFSFVYLAFSVKAKSLKFTKVTKDQRMAVTDLRMPRSLRPERTLARESTYRNICDIPSAPVEHPSGFFYLPFQKRADGSISPISAHTVRRANPPNTARSPVKPPLAGFRADVDLGDSAVSKNATTCRIR
jgi:hypothetical protein